MKASQLEWGEFKASNETLSQYVILKGQELPLCSRAPAWHMHEALGLFTAPQKRKQVEQGSVGTGCRHSTLAGQLQGWTLTCQEITAGD